MGGKSGLKWELKGELKWELKWKLKGELKWKLKGELKGELKCLEKAVEGKVGIAIGLVEQGDELRTDDGSGCVVLCCRQCLVVRDAETYHARIAQLHRVDSAEVGLLLLVEGALRPRDGGRGHHVDEAVGVGVDEADAFVGGFGSDEHDDSEVVAVGHGLHLCQIVLKGQVGDNHARNAAVGAGLAEGVDAVVQDGVEVAHEDERHGDFRLDGVQLLEETLEAHAVAQRLGGCRLDDGTVGQGVAEGDAYFDEVDASALHGDDDVGGAVEGWRTGTEIEGEQFAVASVGEELVNFVHCLGGVDGLNGEYGRFGIGNGEGRRRLSCRVPTRSAN